jgi:uncharacterized RDD family membrane protein YckC
MNCLRCGEICSCQSDVHPPSATSSADEGSAPVAGPRFVTPLQVIAEEHLDSQPQSSDIPGEPSASSPDVPSPEPDLWRDELSARLSRYRARRKARPPRYPSLQLQFDSASSHSSFVPVADGGLALDGMSQLPMSPVLDISITDAHPAPEGAEEATEAAKTLPRPENMRPERGSAKIIEFPRFLWAQPAPPVDQLAEPVADRPRILDVPEATPPPPALGGITIEAARSLEVQRRPGIDVPLQGASLMRRILAGGIDGLIVAAASVFFAFIFWKVLQVRPPLIQILGMAAAVPFLFWTGFQYLLIVYAGATPGLRAAKLRLARFDGTLPSRSLRRWRVLASYLSALSLGMGYGWLFLDEDALCWHDRITHTYMAPANQSRKL